MPAVTLETLLLLLVVDQGTLIATARVEPGPPEPAVTAAAAGVAHSSYAVPDQPLSLAARDPVQLYIFATL